MTVKDLLEFLFTRGVPAIFVYWLMERPILLRWLGKAEDFFKLQLGVSLSAVKRVISMLLSIGASTAAFVLYASLGYAALPVDGEGWANLILYLASVTYAGSQVIHAKDMK